MTYPDHPTAVAAFSFFFDRYRAEIQRIADQYPEEQAFVLQYSDIEMHDLEMAEFLLKSPNRALYAASVAIKECMHPDKVVDVAFRVAGFSKSLKTPIRNLRSRHLGKLVVVDGLVRKITFVKPDLKDGRFECLRCGQIISMPQEGFVFKEPLECYKEQAGCGRGATSTKFRLLTEESGWIDSQKIEIQESPEGLAGGAEPQRLLAFATDDMAGLVSPGDRITLVGTLRTLPQTGNKRSTTFDTYMDINNIEVSEKGFDEIVITEDEEDEIVAAGKDESIIGNIVSSIAPNIYGLRMEKLALALQLFGGIPKNMADGTRIRGDIHVLLIGDPGTAKSQLLQYIRELAPRAVMASGRAASGAGLTCAAVKDDFGDGRWTLEAGALVLADRGQAIIDEFDKVSSQDRSSLHEAMEQQRISVAKAGITATLQSRCAMLAAANPQHGRFDDHSLISEQINIPVALLSRFDVILTVMDKPDEKRDDVISKHILQVHVAGEMREGAGKPREDAGWDDSVGTVITPLYDRGFLRKYIAYSKTNIVPVLTPKATEALHKFYATIRKSWGGESDTVAITARQLESLIRLAEASARMRLSTIATEDDAKLAISILEYYLDKTAGVDGKYDIDRITTGVSASLRDKIRKIQKILNQLGAGDAVIHFSDVLADAELEGIDEHDLETVLNRLCDYDAYIRRVGMSKRKFKLNKST